MIRPFTAAALSGLSALLGACATNIKVLEIPMLDAPNAIATRREPDLLGPPKVIQYVEVPKPQSLPSLAGRA